MRPHELFKTQCAQNINLQGHDEELESLAREFFNGTFKYKYSYNFECLGRPIIQYPQDIVVLQELIWKVQPDLRVSARKTSRQCARFANLQQER
jgi:cephalosporin hydroxylase